MRWQALYRESHPAGRVVRAATGKPLWVWTVPAVVAGLVLLPAALVLVVSLFAAVLAAGACYAVLSAVASLLPGGGPRPGVDPDDGRRNVRVVPGPDAP